jgi:hypothetical protein
VLNELSITGKLEGVGFNEFWVAQKRRNIVLNELTITGKSERVDSNRFWPARKIRDIVAHGLTIAIYSGSFVQKREPNPGNEALSSVLSIDLRFISI